MDKDPFDGMAYKNDANGVSLCIVYENGRVQCTDIYVPEDVTEVRLTGCEEIEMLDTDESFPNVTKLIIGKDIERIQMANSLFPNVREVISESCWFASGKYIVFQFMCDKDEIFLSLENTFCLRPDEILDLKDINRIDDYALDGCMTTNLINTEKIQTLGINVTDGSAFEDMDFGEDGLLKTETLLFKIDASRDTINIPANITAIDFDNVMFWNMQKVIINNINCLQLGRYGLSDTVVFSDTVRTKDRNFSEIKEAHSSFLTVSKIEVDIHNQDFKSIDGILYSKDGKILLKCPVKKTGDIVIPEGTEEIMENAFFQSKIKSVKLPDSMKKIGAYAFYQCKNLKSVDFGNGIKEIGKAQANDNDEYVFSECQNLKHVVFSEQIETIGLNAFDRSGIESLILPKNIKYIAFRAFSGCAIKNLYIPSADVFIGVDAFCDTNDITVANADYLPTGLINAGMVELVFKDKSYFLPRYVRRIDVSKINEILCSTETPVEDILSSLYQFGKTWELKVDAAIKTYVSIKDKGIALYLKKVSKKIAYDYMYASRYEELAKFLDLGFVSKATLKELQKETKVMEIPEVAAVILRELDQKQITPKRFSL